MSLRLTPDRRPIGRRRSTCESRRYTVLSASPDSSPYIHPPSVHHSPSKTWTPSPFTAHRSFQETSSPAYPTTSFSLPSAPERQENAEYNSGSPPVSPRSASVSTRSVLPSLDSSDPYPYDFDGDYSD
jgi:hypothetical protein